MKIKLSRLKNKTAHKSMNPWDYSGEANPEDGPCGTCKKFADIPGVNCIYCDKCSFWFHGTCVGIPYDEIEYLSWPFIKWICPTRQQPELPDDTQIMVSRSSDFIICKHCMAPPLQRNIKHTSYIRSNLNNWNPPPDIKSKFKPSSAEKRAEAKLADFDTRGAVKILSTDDTLAEMNGTAYTKLVEKHPAPSRVTFSGATN
ncbi:unnamed protein product [Orchesella dallaii]|uniref:Zinc finger PHD-type domain-containing protein n=1 Tax=Orchesella dallaii TaxID=48710 RepID=A0ABP1PU81_9HEXA